MNKQVAIDPSVEIEHVEDRPDSVLLPAKGKMEINLNIMHRKDGHKESINFI